MSYPAYAETKPSGVEWLGDVPKDWPIVASKYLYSIQLGKMLQNAAQSRSDVQVAYLKAVNVQWENVNIDDPDTRMWASKTEMYQYDVQEGDLLVCEGGEVGRAGIVPELPEKFIIQNALHRVRSKSNDLRYLMYLLEAATQAKWFDVLCNKATIAHFTSEKFGAFRFACPTLSEQQQIAAFLDRKTAELDAVLRLKERQLELLAEKRQALISQAVTRGLDPTAPLKPSGISWLGDVPEHWEVTSLKHLAKIKYGLGQPPSAMDDGLPLLRATNVERGKINPKGLMFIDPNDVPYDRDPVLKTNDIIVVRSGAYTGDSAIVPAQYDGAIAGYDMVVRAKKANPFYLAYGLLSTPILNNQIDLLRMRAAQPHLNAEELGECLFFIPPIAEQSNIVAYLDRETARMDSTTQAIRAQIGKVREYRQALISAAVTGKIDVRRA